MPSKEFLLIELLTNFLRQHVEMFDDSYAILPVFDGLQAYIILLSIGDGISL
jgi:hypothetical protein